jgi:hypothetical protein
MLSREQTAQKEVESISMSTIAINDLPTNRVLDSKAMSAVRGAGASWVYGWISPFVAATPSVGPAVNFYQFNNSYYIDQMINQVQVVDINNTAANSNVNVVLDERSANDKH